VKTGSSNEVSAAEAARRLQIELDYLYRLVWSGKLSGRKVGRTWRIPFRAIDERKEHLAQ
jgi:excisionase family DNA binding protein